MFRFLKQIAVFVLENVQINNVLSEKCIREGVCESQKYYKATKIQVVGFSISTQYDSQCALFNMIKVEQGDTILDVGCGDLRLLYSCACVTKAELCIGLDTGKFINAYIYTSTRLSYENNCFVLLFLDLAMLNQFYHNYNNHKLMVRDYMQKQTITTTTHALADVGIAEEQKTTTTSDLANVAISDEQKTSTATSNVAEIANRTGSELDW